MADLLDISKWGVESTPDLIQQLALLMWLKKGRTLVA